MTRGSRWGRALLLLCTIAACGDRGPRGAATGAGGEAGPAEATPARGPFAELPFPQLGDADYEVDPEVGIELARSHVLVTLADGADEAAALAALAAVKGELVGALGQAGVILVRLPGEVVGAARHTAVDALRAHPAVKAASLDLRVGPTLLPPAGRGAGEWDWSRHSGTQRFWSLVAMGMPIAWNLKPLLDEDPPAARRVTVAITDSGLQAHPDLVPERIFGGSGVSAPHVPGDANSYHATAVAGIIAARWDGRFADGISPNAGIIAGDGGTTAVSSGAERVKSLARIVESTWRTTQSVFTPRLLNLSLGVNFYRTCHAVKGRSRRCDPRIGAEPADAARWGAPAPDADCKGALVRAALAAHAEAFSRMVDRAQARGPLFVVAAAGNDSQPDRGDPCTPARTRSGLGPFPAELASPFNWAGLRLGNPNILVAEVVRENLDMRGDLTRADYSNIDGHILAPGDDITGLAGGPGDATMAWFSGTSSAAPHVTGAAAYLLNLNPGLDNATLRALLLAQDGRPVAGTRTTKRLYVPTAIERMRVRMPGGGRTEPGDVLLVDMDDGSLDGFTRLVRDDLGAIQGPYQTRRNFKTQPVRVDMADFRYFRDSAILLETNLSCAADMPACDLNADGRFDVADATADDATLVALERFPRAQLVPRIADAEALARSPAAIGPLQRYWDGDAVQGWRADELPGLMGSSDFEFYPQAFMNEAGAAALRVTLLGAVTPPTAPTRREPYTDREIRGRTVWTAPLHEGIRLRVQIVGGAMDGRVLESDVPEVGPGRHAHVILNPCALRPDSRALLTTDRVRSCEDNLPPVAIQVEGGGPPRGDAGTTTGGAPPPAPGAADSCEALARGGAPYACFRLTAEGYDSGPVTIVEPPEKNAGLYHGYYNANYDNWPLKLQGRATVNGSLEDVYMTLMFWGRETRQEAWNPDQEGNNDFSLYFTTTDFPGARTLRAFQVAYGPGGQNVATRVDAVGGFIEGTFHGDGHLFVRVGDEDERRPGARIRGSFRVRRGPDP